MSATKVHPRYVKTSEQSRGRIGMKMSTSGISGATPFAIVIACAGLAILLSLLSVGALAYNKAYADEPQASSFDIGITTSLNAMSAFTVEEGENALDIQADLVADRILEESANAAQEQSKSAVEIETVKELEDHANAEAANIDTYTDPATNATPENQAAASSEKIPDMSAASIDVDGVQMGYVDSYLSAAAPSVGAGLWLGSDSTTDGSYAYFVGHNPGPFWHVMDFTNGDEVTVCDSAGATRVYHVVNAFTVPDTTYLEDIQSLISGYGESVILQTCCGDNATYRIVIAN